jgi:multidrug efflux system membrane fusion protein
MTGYRQARLLVLAVVTLAACTQPEPPRVMPRPVVVAAPLPLHGPADDQALPGAVHARVEADLAFRVPGKIAERHVDMGAHVDAGTVLAVLDPVDARLTVAAARARLAAAEADLGLARAEEQRYRDLRERQFVGASPLDQRVNITKLAAARVEQARAEYDLAANQSRYTNLRADAAGVITQVLAEPGNVVSAGQPVVRFAADGEREVHVNVPEGRLDALREAPSLLIQLLSHPTHAYAGRVRDIDPQADEATRTHLARITLLEPDERVQLGATATMMVTAESRERSFRVPSTALGKLPDKGAAVWRVIGTGREQTVEAVPVEVLRFLDGEALITGNLDAQDRLVTAGVHRLVAGMSVEAIDRAAKAAL